VIVHEKTRVDLDESSCVPVDESDRATLPNRETSVVAVPKLGGGRESRIHLHIAKALIRVEGVSNAFTLELELGIVVNVLELTPGASHVVGARGRDALLRGVPDPNDRSGELVAPATGDLHHHILTGNPSENDDWDPVVVGGRIASIGEGSEFDFDEVTTVEVHRRGDR